MKKIFYSFIYIAICSVAVSCDSKLDILQKGVVDESSFYQTDEECEEAAIALYGAMNDNATYQFMTKAMLDDDTWAGGGGRGDNVNNELINEYRYTTDNQWIEGLFKNGYQMIYRANLILTNVSPDSQSKKRNIAEAYFFRAWAYFDLVTLFGPVPKVTEIVKDGNYSKPNSDIDELWVLMEEDLKNAIDMQALPEKNSLDDNITGIRVTHQLAQALLGKVYVFQGKYQEASNVFEEVIKSGKYGLFQGEYGDIFAAPYNFNREIMLAINKVNDPTKYSFDGLCAMCGWREDKFEGFYAAYQSKILDVYPMGWGQSVPTKSLYDAFVGMEGEDGYRLNQTLVSYKQLVEKGVTIKDGQYVYGCEGYLTWKRRNTPSSYVAGTYAGFYNNFVFMRYAEVLLLASEANLQVGNISVATNYLNAIRTRAKLPNLNHTITLDDIKKEKRLELCNELIRYQDLTRWGDAYEALKDKGDKIPALYGLKEDGSYDIRYLWTNTEYGYKKNKHELLPIPQYEMNVNDMISQNPGW